MTDAELDKAFNSAIEKSIELLRKSQERGREQTMLCVSVEPVFSFIEFPLTGPNKVKITFEFFI